MSPDMSAPLKLHGPGIKNFLRWRLSRLCHLTTPGQGIGRPIANDGEWYVLEGISDSHYHVITRQVPGDTYRKLCLYMLKLSRISSN